mmetsp:Transcript_66821/g.215393  ORF Transcript_66821/g.215393 Transcript_66821/m.215393 type:complete len:202 (-) Transcript_66821:1056-1661(-)
MLCRCCLPGRLKQAAVGAAVEAGEEAAGACVATTVEGAGKATPPRSGPAARSQARRFAWQAEAEAETTLQRSGSEAPVGPGLEAGVEAVAGARGVGRAAALSRTPLEVRAAAGLVAAETAACEAAARSRVAAAARAAAGAVGPGTARVEGPGPRWRKTPPETAGPRCLQAEVEARGRRGRQAPAEARGRGGCRALAGAQGH